MIVYYQFNRQHASNAKCWPYILFADKFNYASYRYASVWNPAKKGKVNV